mgnify:CR=1 FL=1
MAKTEKKVNKIKPRGLQKLKLGGGEKMQKAAYKLGDGNHADMPGSTPESDKKMYRYQESADRLAGTGIDLDPDKTTPTKMYSPIKKALVGDQNQLPEQLQQEILDSPAKFVSPGMTPMATGGGFKMQMGSKENFSGTNFSNKDQGTMSQAPSIMKDDWGGETIEMKDQGQKKTNDGSPLNYGMRSQVAKKRKMSEAENLQEGLNTRAEDKRQSFNDILKVANTVANLGATAASAGAFTKKPG